MLSLPCTRRTQSRKEKMKEEFSTGRVVIVAAPAGVDPQTALFSRGVDIQDGDVLVTIERPGNVEVEVLDTDE